MKRVLLFLSISCAQIFASPTMQVGLVSQDVFHKYPEISLILNEPICIYEDDVMLLRARTLEVTQNLISVWITAEKKINKRFEMIGQTKLSFQLEAGIGMNLLSCKIDDTPSTFILLAKNAALHS